MAKSVNLESAMENEFVAPQKLHFTPAAWAVLAAFAKELSTRAPDQDIGPILVQWVRERQYGDRGKMIDCGPGPILTARLPRPVPEPWLGSFEGIRYAARLPKNMAEHSGMIEFDVDPKPRVTMLSVQLK